MCGINVVGGGGGGKCSLTLSTCLSKELALQQQQKKKDRTGSFKRKETVLVPVHQCVELWSIECVRDEVRDTESDYLMRTPSRCWLGAVSRYWKVVASCFQIVSFAENTSAALAPRAGISQPILFLFFICFLPLEFVYKTLPQIFNSVSKFSGAQKKTELTLKRLFSNVPK